MTNECPCCGRTVSDPEWHEYHRHEDCWVEHFTKDERPNQVKLTPAQTILYEEVKALQHVGKPKNRPIKRVGYETGNIRIIPSSAIRGRVRKGFGYEGRDGG